MSRPPFVANSRRRECSARRRSRATFGRRGRTQVVKHRVLLGVIAVAGLTACGSSSSLSPAFLRRATAALGNGPITHVVWLQPTGSANINLRTGKSTPTGTREEIWTNTSGSTVHLVARRRPSGHRRSPSAAGCCPYQAAWPVGRRLLVARYLLERLSHTAHKPRSRAADARDVRGPFGRLASLQARHAIGRKLAPAHAGARSRCAQLRAGRLPAHGFRVPIRRADHCLQVDPVQLV